MTVSSPLPFIGSTRTSKSTNQESHFSSTKSKIQSSFLKIQTQLRNLSFSRHQTFIPKRNALQRANSICYQRPPERIQEHVRAQRTLSMCEETLQLHGNIISLLHSDVSTSEIPNPTFFSSPDLTATLALRRNSEASPHPIHITSPQRKPWDSFASWFHRSVNPINVTKPSPEKTKQPTFRFRSRSQRLPSLPGWWESNTPATIPEICMVCSTRQAPISLSGHENEEGGGNMYVQMVDMDSLME